MSNDPHADPAAQLLRLVLASDALTRWLSEQALPLWTRAGVDRAQGGFFEQLDAAGAPIEEPRRARVVARQIYVFATASRLGWMAGADRLVDHGLRFLFERLRQADGRYAAAVLPDGRVVRDAFDLYEHAFILFALASAFASRPSLAHLPAEAMALLRAMRLGWSHPVAGFEEAAPPTLPLKANPHMHLFEAALAWEGVAPADDAPTWRALSDEIAGLALGRLIDTRTGALREYFDAQWRPMAGAPGRIVEPGHQFEWAWLLMRWGIDRERPDALDAARRLLEIGERHGVDGRGVAIEMLRDDFEVLDARARLWPQTERIKAWHAMHALAHEPALKAMAAQRAVAAIEGLQKFLTPAPAGSWCELLDADGRRQPGPARASSLYHVVCAIETLHGRSG